LALLQFLLFFPFPLAFFVKEPPSSLRPARVNSSEHWSSAFKSVPFYVLIVGSMCSIAAVSGTQQNLKLFLTLDAHYGQGQAARILSLVLASSMAGRLLMGWLADRFPKKYVMLLIYLLVAGAIPFLFVTGSPVLMYAFAILFGIGLGGDYMIIPLITAEIFDARLLGRLLGVILTAGGIAEAVAPWIVGHIRDVAGSYSNGFLFLIAMSLLGAVVVAFLPKQAVRA
jgi:MFS family permease